MAIKIGHASGSENGTIKGKAGDQTGREVYTRGWYKHSKGWVTLRCKDPNMREHIARAMEMACANDAIGYNQYENQTLYNNVKPYGFNPSKTTKNVNTDCARLVRVCVQYACEQVGNGVIVPDFYTASEAKALVNTGLFEKLTDSKYNTQDKYLLRGDIQVTKTKGHTFVILQNGSKSGSDTNYVEPEIEYGGRMLRNGSEGSDVKQLQNYLIQLGYDCGSWGADGDFGDATEMAVEAFQRDNKLEVDGVVGPMTYAALEAALQDKIVVNAKQVKIVGGNCYVRTEPRTDVDNKIGTAHKGDVYTYLGEMSEEGWHKIDFKGKQGWVSGKYSDLV